VASSEAIDEHPNAEHLRLPMIVGRDEELSRAAALLDTGSALLLKGDAGIGKTTVWRAACQLALSRGFRVLAATPAEAEQTFSYSVLGDLFEDIGYEPFAALPPVQRRAVERSLLLADDEGAADARTVAVAVRNVLHTLAHSEPVLIAIDDVQWTDSASTAALDFALRRLGNARLRVLLAVRTGHAVPFMSSSERVDIGSLSLGALHHLVVERLGKTFSRTGLRRLHEVSGGNPFYALELARASRPDEEIVFPESLEAVVADRIRALPSDTLRALAVLALAGDSQSQPALEPAVDAGVLERAGDELRFSHPLLAEASVALVGPRERRALHREIAAAASDPEQRARHLARAAHGPDEQIATALAEAAASTSRRGAPAASAELWRLAAQLTLPDDVEVHRERLVHAGIAHILAGDIDEGSRLISQHIEDLPPGSVRDLGVVHHALALAQKDISATIPKLERALTEVVDERTRMRLVGFLCAFHSISGDYIGAADLAAAHLHEAESIGGATLAAALVLCVQYELALDRQPNELLERALANGLEGEAEPWYSLARVRASAHLREGRFDEARVALVKALAELDERGEDIWRSTFQLTLVEIELSAGRLETARTLAEDVLDHAEQLGTPHMISLGLAATAVAELLRGHGAEARRRATRSLELAEEVNAGIASDQARFTLALIALTLGNAAEAAKIYSEVPEAHWHRWWQVAGSRPLVDAIGALATSGAVQEADRLLSFLAADARERPIAEAHLAAAHGDFERAIDLVRSAAQSPAPLGQAREQLLYGTLLRRARHRTGARDALARARTEFEHLGTPLWLERVDEELSRLGGRTPSGNALTPSEQRVAELVASGSSNKQVAATLVVSVATVEAHLSRIYAKLGVRSRTALAAVWPRDLKE
jgi:DNA-binding CsgD family transcriptional regulator/tetratricopeptide (TPR) repeat protein